MKKVLVTGGSGLVGSRFVELYRKKYRLFTPDRPEFDLTWKETLKKAISEFKPEAVIHFAAYTDVSAAEDQRNDKKGFCWLINVEGTKNLVSLIDPQRIHFIQISTDYVFPGSKEKPGPSKENDIPEVDPAKLSWYGFTKAEAERIVNAKFGQERTILRLICPVRAKYPQKLDFLRKPLALYDQGKLYPMFNDQQVTISFIDEISLALEKIIDGRIRGNFHASTPDITTPYEIVSYLLWKARGVKNAVKASSIDEFLKSTGASPVRYAKYGGLEVEKTEEALGIKFSPWRQVVETLAATY